MLTVYWSQHVYVDSSCFRFLWLSILQFRGEIVADFVNPCICDLYNEYSVERFDLPNTKRTTISTEPKVSKAVWKRWS